MGLNMPNIGIVRKNSRILMFFVFESKEKLGNVDHIFDGHTPACSEHLVALRWFKVTETYSGDLAMGWS